MIDFPPISTVNNEAALLAKANATPNNEHRIRVQSCRHTSELRPSGQTETGESTPPTLFGGTEGEISLVRRPSTERMLAFSSIPQRKGSTVQLPRKWEVRQGSSVFLPIVRRGDTEWAIRVPHLRRGILRQSRASMARYKRGQYGGHGDEGTPRRYALSRRNKPNVETDKFGCNSNPNSLEERGNVPEVYCGPVRCYSNSRQPNCETKNLDIDLNS